MKILKKLFIYFFCSILFLVGCRNTTITIKNVSSYAKPDVYIDNKKVGSGNPSTTETFTVSWGIHTVSLYWVKNPIGETFGFNQSETLNLSRCQSATLIYGKKGYK